MKSLFEIRPKLKIALTLLIMVSVILVGILVERSFFIEINNNSSSIYKDRLIPATAVFHLSDHITQRRFALEGHLENTCPVPSELQETLAMHRAAMDSIIVAFEKTYLVKNESQSLNMLKEHVKTYDQSEAKLIDKPHAEASGRDLYKLHLAFSHIREELIQLSAIQTDVGTELMHESQTTMAQARGVSDLQVAILLITCVIAQVFILASRAITSGIKQKPGLN